MAKPIPPNNNASTATQSSANPNVNTTVSEGAYPSSKNFEDDPHNIFNIARSQNYERAKKRRESGKIVQNADGTWTDKKKGITYPSDFFDEGFDYHKWYKERFDTEFDDFIKQFSNKNPPPDDELFDPKGKVFAF